MKAADRPPRRVPPVRKVTTQKAVVDDAAGAVETEDESAVESLQLKSALPDRKTAHPMVTLKTPKRAEGAVEDAVEDAEKMPARELQRATQAATA